MYLDVSVLDRFRHHQIKDRSSTGQPCPSPKYRPDARTWTEAGLDSVSDEVDSGTRLLASLNYYSPAWQPGPVGLHIDHVWLLNFAP
jgi:hypothetical protein